MFLEAIIIDGMKMTAEMNSEVLKLILCSLAIFVLVAGHFFLPEKWRTGITAFAAVFTLVGSLYIYSYGYIQYCSSFVSAVLRTILSTIKAFLGSDDWGDVKDVLKTPAEHTFFWVVHMTALITSAGAIAIAIRKLFTRAIRRAGVRGENVDLIYGLSDNTLSFGDKLIEKGAKGVVYVTEDPNGPLVEAAWEMGAVVYTTPEALEATEEFGRKLGLCHKDKKIHLYTLTPSSSSNRCYAAKFVKLLETLAVLPDYTELTLMTVEDSGNVPFVAVTQQATMEQKALYGGDPLAEPKPESTQEKLPLFGKRKVLNRQRIRDIYHNYGYGNVICVDEPNLVGRLLMQKYPPFDVMDFDENGNPARNFHGLIVGFGQVGQAVLRYLVMNSQFNGSDFRLEVFDPHYQQSSGRLLQECSAMFDEYKIHFSPYDGRSQQLFTYLKENGKDITYVAICVGNTAVNDEIADQLQAFLHRENLSVPIFLCSHRGVLRHNDPTQRVPHSIYTPELLQTDRIDRKAMFLHHRYITKQKKKKNIITKLSKEDHWRECDPFSRMSNRAAADFQRAFLAMAHTTEEEARKNWNPTGQLRDNMAINEHLRWNAFHFTMGWRRMTDEEFADRKNNYDTYCQQDPDFRVGKDSKKRFHGCLCSWEELKQYSKEESKVTGQETDYCSYDYDNIESIGQLLQEEADAE